MDRTKCLIIGSGPAGYTAAIYASRANLSPILYEGMQPGGQLTTTTLVENFPGYTDGVDPFTMMDDMKRQAQRFGATIRSGMVTKVDFSCSPKKVWVDNETLIEADTVIIATGASAKYLGLQSEKDYAGKGVSACATCDGFFYRKKTVAVVGGMRRSVVSRIAMQEGLSHCAQTISARFTNNAEQGLQHSEHRSPFRAQHITAHRRRAGSGCRPNIQER